MAAAAATTLTDVPTVELYYLDRGAGFALLENHLQSVPFLRGTKLPTKDDFDAVRQVESQGYNLEKYPFPLMRDWIRRVKTTSSASPTDDLGIFRVVFEEHSPVNRNYQQIAQAAEDKELFYAGRESHVPVSFSYPSDKLSTGLALFGRCSRFTVDPAVFHKLPNLHIITALVLGVRNAESKNILQQQFFDVCQAVRQKRLESVRGRLDLWRRYTSTLKGRGSGLGARRNLVIQSVQAMWARLDMKGKDFTVNPLVDFYNSLSIKHVVTGGGFDLDALPGDLQLRMSRAGDTFLSLDSAADARPALVEEGEVSYIADDADKQVDGNVLTRHLAYRQSKLGLIQEGSKNVFLMFEMPPDLVDAVAPELVKELKNLPTIFEGAQDASVYVQMVSRTDPQVIIPTSFSS